MIQLLERRFRAKVSLEKAWAHLERVEKWPAWAPHIGRVTLSPPGPLTASSQGTIHLRNGIRSTFRVTELNPRVNWKWAGRFLWLTVHYDHRFTPVGPEDTEIAFILQATGLAASTLGRVFAAIYARNLDRAIPGLVKELEAP